MDADVASACCWWTIGQIALSAILLACTVKYVIRKVRNVAILTSGEYVLVTGCDSGIGYQAARLFDELGFTVFAGCLFPNGEGAKNLDGETSANTRIVEMDITDEVSVQNCVKLVSEEVGAKGLWGLVNNAGVLCYGYFEWYTWKQCQKQVDVNLLGTIRVTQAFLPLIQKRKGRIVTVTSMNSLLAYPGISVYCATKYALEGFCNSLRMEQRRHQVQVVTIQLGDFAKHTGIFLNHQHDTEAMWNAMSDHQRAKQRDFFWRFQTMASENRGLLSPPSFQESPLRRVLTSAVVSKQPDARYMCLPFVQSIVMRILICCPSTVSDWIIYQAFNRV